MRACVLGFGLLLAAAASAQADYLRGTVDDELAPPRYTRWEGVYIGGTAGYNASGMDLTRANSSHIAYLMRETTLLDQGRISDWDLLEAKSTSAGSYGAFIGYNRQWDDAVLGIELSYNRTSLGASSQGSLGRVVGVDGSWDVAVSGSASQTISDYGTLRLRGGYAFGRVMPYATIGLAAARAHVDRSTTLCFLRTPTDPAAPRPCAGPASPPWFETVSDSGTKYLFGYAGGLGVDVALTNNIFVRAEWEYIQFGLQNDIRTNINAFRGGAGIKF